MPNTLRVLGKTAARAAVSPCGLGVVESPERLPIADDFQVAEVGVGRGVPRGLRDEAVRVGHVCGHDGREAVGLFGGGEELGVKVLNVGHVTMVVPDRYRRNPFPPFCPTRAVLGKTNLSLHQNHSSDTLFTYGQQRPP